MAYFDMFFRGGVWQMKHSQIIQVTKAHNIAAGKLQKK